MKRSTLLYQRMLPTAIALATAWAARGQIGHEFGATWAGAIGVLTVIAVSGRQDWFKRLPVIVGLGAIAWGAGGMMSYGKIVGYSFAPDYLNTAYGIFMLAIIGGLYGFMGGGVTGLALENTAAKKIDWAALFTQMFAGGFLFWGYFIYQLEWFMTPPRSELWAGCMGASLALGWYLYRNGHTHALRTACFSALGAGFGFGLGVFLQRAGVASGIKFNFWNVMEYSIGFFGGLGMAYGIYSNEKWPRTIAPNRTSNNIGWAFLWVLLPLINLIEAATRESFVKDGERLKLADPAQYASTWQTITWVVSLLLVITFYFLFKKSLHQLNQKLIVRITLMYLTWYILMSHFVSGLLVHAKFDSQHLYWLNLLILGIIMYKSQSTQDSGEEGDSHSYSKLLIYLSITACTILLMLAFVAISINYAHKGAHLRFD